MRSSSTRFGRFLPLLFVALSSADFAMTWWLLRTGTGAVYESNPLANWWLQAFGWAGLACFKASMVVLVLSSLAVVSRSRPRTARMVLRGGCLAIALVVFYSAYLALHVQPDLDREHAEGVAQMERLQREHAGLLQVRAQKARSVTPAPRTAE